MQVPASEPRCAFDETLLLTTTYTPWGEAVSALPEELRYLGRVGVSLAHYGVKAGQGRNSPNNIVERAMSARLVEGAHAGGMTYADLQSLSDRGRQCIRAGRAMLMAAMGAGLVLNEIGRGNFAEAEYRGSALSWADYRLPTKTSGYASDRHPYLRLEFNDDGRTANAITLAMCANQLTANRRQKTEQSTVAARGTELSSRVAAKTRILISHMIFSGRAGLVEVHNTDPAACVYNAWKALASP